MVYNCKKYIDCKFSIWSVNCVQSAALFFVSLTVIPAKMSVQEIAWPREDLYTQLSD